MQTEVQEENVVNDVVKYLENEHLDDILRLLRAEDASGHHSFMLDAQLLIDVTRGGAQSMVNLGSWNRTCRLMGRVRRYWTGSSSMTSMRCVLPCGHSHACSQKAN